MKKPFITASLLSENPSGLNLKTKPLVVLHLSVNTAKQLYEFVRNPHTDNESSEERQLRETIFTSLRQILQ